MSKIYEVCVWGYEGGAVRRAACPQVASPHDGYAALEPGAAPIAFSRVSGTGGHSLGVKKLLRCAVGACLRRGKSRARNP